MPPLCVPKWYLAVIGAVAVQRLGELYVSRSNEARIRGVRAASSTYPLRVLAHVGLVTLPLVRSRGLSRASARVASSRTWARKVSRVSGSSGASRWASAARRRSFRVARSSVPSRVATTRRARRSAGSGRRSISLALPGRRGGRSSPFGRLRGCGGAKVNLEGLVGLLPSYTPGSIPGPRPKLNSPLPPFASAT
jgi:hypothetical protein